MAQYTADLLASSRDLLMSIDRSAMALNMVAHTLENEFSERFGHTGVSCSCSLAGVLTKATVAKGNNRKASSRDVCCRRILWKLPRGYASCKGGTCAQDASFAWQASICTKPIVSHHAVAVRYMWLWLLDSWLGPARSGLQLSCRRTYPAASRTPADSVAQPMVLDCCRELPSLKQECQALLSCKQVSSNISQQRIRCTPPESGPPINTSKCCFH